MIEKLKSIMVRYQEVEDQLHDVNLISDIKVYKETNRTYKQLTPLAEVATKYLRICKDIENNKEMIADKTIDFELRDMAQEEMAELQAAREAMDEELKILLLPKDPNDLKSAIVEIRAGTGGDEAGIFGGDLFRMYKLYADKSKYQLEIISLSESERGGFKEIVFLMSGDDVFGNLKFESGVHRVQRVPETESQGRVHTSAATVAVLPEAEDIDIEIREEDLRVDIYHAGGHGGQNVNKVATAVRYVHIPSGLVVTCQDERSQLKNRDKAMKVLRSRLYEMELEKQQSEIASSRKSMVKSGDRSEKIRTYNWPQNRVTDHRLEGDAKNYSLKDIIEGNLETLIENLKIAERTEILKQGLTI